MLEDSELDEIKMRKLEEMMRKNNEKIKSGEFNKNHKIIIYSTDSCPYCSITKNYLRTKGIKFEDVNVGRDQKRAQEMIQKSGQMGVPVIDFDGEIIVGFNKYKIDVMLNQ